MRTIDGDALRDKLQNLADDDWNQNTPTTWAEAFSECADMVEDAPTIESEPHWIKCSEGLPDEDHWLGGSGRQFSEKVMVTIVNHSDEDTWVDTTYTIDGKWALELPRHCEITAWCELPEPYREGES